jgi:hypothetical protein
MGISVKRKQFELLSVNKVLDGKNQCQQAAKDPSPLKISHGAEFDLLEFVGVQCCVVIQHNKIDGQAELRAKIMAVLNRI